MRTTSSFFPKTRYQAVIHNPSCSTQKLHFSVNSNGQGIKFTSYIDLLHDPSRIASLNEVKCFHALVITVGSLPTQDPIFLHNNIIVKYAALSEISIARTLFDGMPQRNVVTYNSMISCYGRDGILPEVFRMFSRMRKCGLKPTQFTFGCLLSCHWLDILEGMQLLVLIEKTGLFDIDAFAGTALLGMYGRHGCFDEALEILEFMPVKNVATWNSMISVLCQMGFVEDFVLLFSEIMFSQVEFLS